MNHLIYANRDAFFYIIKSFVGDPITYRSLALTCKLFHSICTEQLVLEKMTMFSQLFTKDIAHNSKRIIGTRLPDKSFHGLLTISKNTVDNTGKTKEMRIKSIDYVRGIPKKIVKYDKHGNVLKEKTLLIKGM